MYEVAPESPPLFDHSQADLCVACGLCLPVCPTYELTRTENESPRGRLSLARGLALGKLPADEQLASHLDRCTLCLACEKACPAGVGFAEQMVSARTWLAANGFAHHSLAENVLLKAIAKGGQRLERLGSIARSYQRNPLRRVLRGSGLLRISGLDSVDQQLPAFAAATDFADSYPAIGEQRARLALFTGCLQDQTDPETLPAAIELLTHHGYTVDLPKDQVCCGGLHLHSGEAQEAARLASQNESVFEQYEIVVGVASGCEAVLKNYPGIGGRIRDIDDLLAENPAEPGPEYAPLPETVLVHEPCSHRNQLGGSQAAHRLLQRIPQLQLQPLPGNQFCCGGAGNYPLSQPVLAAQMREPKLAALAELQPRYLVTTNIGCALHLRAGLADRGLDVEILHPVALLARLLLTNTSTNETCANTHTADMV